MIKETSIIKDEYTDYVISHYDLQVKDKIITEIPILDKEELNNTDWNIFVILGNSGSGKSTILQTLGNVYEKQYDYSKCIISQYQNKSVEEVIDVFFSVGLSSVPLWLHKPNELSNGERARLDIASALLSDEEVILIDEFTSVVNRNVAKTMSNSLGRYVRKNNKKIILCSCHFDIIEWLKPDLIFNLNKRNNRGGVDLEHIIYSDSENYISYDSVSMSDILSEKVVIDDN